MKKAYSCIFAFLFSFGMHASAQNDSPYEEKIITAVRTSEPIKMDGVLSESIWETAVPATAFRQVDPSEGAPATEDTQVRIAYDAHNLYIGVICSESDPSVIVRSELKYDGDVGNDDHSSLSSTRSTTSATRSISRSMPTEPVWTASSVRRAGMSAP